MPRFIPEVTHTCHICGNAFVIHNRFEPGRGILSNPTTCPRCTAPVKAVPSPESGRAKDLILAFYGGSYYRENYGSADRLLESLCLTTKDVDTYFSLIKHLNFQEWVEQMEEFASDPEMTEDDREIVQLLPQIVGDAESGRLLTEFCQIVESVKERLRLEREQYLSRLESN